MRVCFLSEAGRPADYLPLLKVISENSWLDLAFVEGRKPILINDNIKMWLQRDKVEKPSNSKEMPRPPLYPRSVDEPGASELPKVAIGFSAGRKELVHFSGCLESGPHPANASHPLATMTEPDVALTDFLLTAQCGGFSYWLSRIQTRRSRLQSLCIRFFAVVGLAALIGGAVHGYFNDESSWQFQLLWRAGLVVLGAGSYFSWLIGAELLWRDTGRERLRRFALACLLLYWAFILFWDQHFLFALWNYLPATLFLFLAFVLQIRTGRKQPALFGASGVLITFVAAAVQRLGIALHPTYFNHNALYHVLQAVALVFLLAAFRRLIRDEEMDKTRVTQATPDRLAGAAEILEEQSAVERRRT